MTALLVLLFVVVVGYAVKALCELIRDYEQLVRFTRMWKNPNTTQRKREDEDADGP